MPDTTKLGHGNHVYIYGVYLIEIYNYDYGNNGVINSESCYIGKWNLVGGRLKSAQTNQRHAQHKPFSDLFPP